MRNEYRIAITPFQTPGPVHFIELRPAMPLPSSFLPPSSIFLPLPAGRNQNQTGSARPTVGAVLITIVPTAASPGYNPVLFHRSHGYPRSADSLTPVYEPASARSRPAHPAVANAAQHAQLNWLTPSDLSDPVRVRGAVPVT